MLPSPERFASLTHGHLSTSIEETLDLDCTAHSARYYLCPKSAKILSRTNCPDKVTIGIPPPGLTLPPTK